MKLILNFLNVLILCNVANSQNKNASLNISVFKFDTITANFIVEIGSRSSYYYQFDATLQGNNIFFDYGYSKKELALMYKSDSLVSKFSNLGHTIKGNYTSFDYLHTREFKKYINLMAINNFFSSIDERTLTRYKRRILRKSIFKDINGVSYLRIYAKIKVISKIKNYILIPKVYCSENDTNNFEVFCEKYFNSIFILVDILNWNFT